MSDSPGTVCVVDDDAPFLAAIARLLRAAGYTVRTFASASQYLAQVGDPPGCLIADLRMPGIGGLELQEALIWEAQAPPIIFLTGQGDILTSVRAMRQGAEDFLTKDAPQDALLDAVERALARDAQQRTQRKRSLELRARFNRLTPREAEVLQHVASGRLSKQIASDLRISERTVKLHRGAITSKLGVRSVAEIVRLMHEASLSEVRSRTFQKRQ
jgi:FixJ family two-component response regulator